MDDAGLTTKVRSARKAKGLGHLRRAEILAAAERVFLSDGYEGATIRRIAEEVGVSSTALYMHFQDKGEILVEICEATFAGLLAQNAAVGALAVDPVERVRRMLDAYMRFAFENPNAYQLVYCSTSATLPEERMVGVRATSERCYALFRGAVQAIAEEGRLKGGVEESAQVTWAACHGLVALLIARPAFEWGERETLMRLMLDSLMAGVIKA